MASNLFLYYDSQYFCICRFTQIYSLTVQNETHVRTNLFLTMTYTITFQNITFSNESLQGCITRMRIVIIHRTRFHTEGSLPHKLVHLLVFFYFIQFYGKILKTIHILNRISTRSLARVLSLNFYEHICQLHVKLKNEQVYVEENPLAEVMYDVKLQHTSVIYIYIFFSGLRYFARRETVQHCVFS